ncbi:MSMEG_0567/sll0787 family protein [Conexibacter sp. SYSU D00693]|uniref:MSMEG_0567/sll0787 family protein n=1 Tax=Conexibacter sp. SYSU D00693 TaxID=2812560 RepID=UPI001F11DE91|nr:MSMEG_0567/sll0787 family protein [Conexibacter sp. SYSU D00693]
MSTATLTHLRVVRAEDDPRRLAAYHAMRRRAFVEQQGLFAREDLDDHDAAPGIRVLVAVDHHGDVLGGVRLHPVGDDPALGWWRGSRLVCSEVLGLRRGAVGAALVRAACGEARRAGALRFDAHVQARHASFFARLGWDDVRALDVGGAAHRLMRWPVLRLAALAQSTKAPLGPLLAEALGTPAPWLGDDGVPVAGSDLVACTDAILPAMVDGDPEWAAWCAMLVTAHDLSAMGASPVGALDALAAPDAEHAQRLVRGLRAGADAFRLPVLGGHTQLGVSAALSVSGLGRTTHPVPAGGGTAGDTLSVTADLHGGWRRGYGHRQWDSSTSRSRDELAQMLDAVGVARPRAAKDVSMAGVVGTTGMLAEASGCGAELDVAAIPRPPGTDAGDWLTCFPGFAMVTADRRDAPPLPAGPATGAACGVLTSTPGVRLRWPDGDVTTAIPAGVTGLGPAAPTQEPTA